MRFWWEFCWEANGIRFWWEFSCIFVWKQLGSDYDEIFHVFSSRSNWEVIVMRIFMYFHLGAWSRWDFSLGGEWYEILMKILLGGEWHEILNENFHVFSSESNWEVIVMRFFMYFRLEAIGKWLWWEFSCIFIWEHDCDGIFR